MVCSEVCEDEERLLTTLTTALETAVSIYEEVKQNLLTFDDTDAELAAVDVIHSVRELQRHCATARARRFGH